MPGRDLTGRGCTQGGAGEYPLSEPETRAVFTFLLEHPNVASARPWTRPSRCFSTARRRAG